MKLWKKILIIIGIILIVALAVILYRYSILTKILKRNEESNKRTNCYYYSETENTIMEYWRKDGIMKLHTKQTKGKGDIIFWEDTNTGEELIFWNAKEKLYSKGNGGMLKRLPTGMMFTEEDGIRFLMAAYPMLHISSKKYDNKDCYFIEIDGHEEIIEKDRGLILKSTNGGNRKISYEFDNVTDKDVKKPDITQYKWRES